MTVREQLNTIASQRILILDGAMASMIQSLKLSEADFRGTRFANHQTPLLGCNDLLCLSRPEAISAIHRAYLEAGADIIETCSFNSTTVSLADYGIGELVYEISRASAILAREAADTFSTADKPRFVAGSIGPTGKSASLSPDISDPAKRAIYWDELEAAYYDNARGLLDGGADILLLETIFDTLNAKAALFAAGRLLKERGIDVPIMISATVSGDSGRLLSGQTLEAFCESILPAEPWAVGLNCSFGAEKLLPHIRLISGIVPCLVCAYPNAGLPNQLGGYDESPETMSSHIGVYLKEGLVNITGGCCGSTPEHIAAIAAKAALYQPRVPPQTARPSCLAGLELLTINSPSPLTLIGERTNVAGSRKFLRLISEDQFDDAADFARDMIEDGADIISVGMDDAMLDAEKAMGAFLGAALFDPYIAKVPVMIDSSRWNVIEAGLKHLQGKGLVNSINLKDGEAEFLRRAALVRRYGAAVVVMLIDEQGQAVSYGRKIEIAGRAYRLLVESGFPPENIVFDPNVLAVATGISESDSCAIDFIRACAWIRDNCPRVQISGGISNLSYSFRGNNALREAMHSVFLVHAAAAGLTMAIVNPAALTAYNDIEENLRNAVEDVILNRSPGAADRLIGLAEKINTAVPAPHSPPSSAANWRNESVESRIIHALLKGVDDFIEADVLELMKNKGGASGKAALEIVEGPLMDGMKEVGKRFDEGTMYLPQMIRSAQVMKKAAAALEPYMEKRNDALSPKIVLATVKGDVHDIGKNIVAVVLACNGYQIVDLGVMIPADRIIEAAEKEQAAIIGLSGLISPSLDEMAHIARKMEKRGMKIPLLVGGAAASLAHTSLRLAPEYSGPVVYVPNAGKSAETVHALLSAAERPRFLQNIEQSYRDAACRHETIQSRLEIIPLESARANKTSAASSLSAPQTTGIIDLNDYPLDRVIPYIDWNAFLQKKAPATISDAQALLERIKTEGLLKLRGVAGIFPAAAAGDDVIIGSARFCFLRSQNKKPAGIFNSCLADFLAPADGGRTIDWLGLFALSVGFGAENTSLDNNYDTLLLASLANALTEAFTEEIHLRIRREWWGYAPDESLSVEEILKGGYAGIRPAFGYPSCPDHEDKRIAFELLEAEKRCGLKLTDTAMIIPAASACGMFFANPAAYYFGIGTIGEDQLADWAGRKGISVKEARLRTGYSPFVPRR
ncbi:MAG: methionine synthase [Treponema sp.]|jgi:5-methyltetrahydrofolate--homocysteine methyltransferase|nr:methionine synthase [Treponema sp.]